MRALAAILLFVAAVADAAPLESSLRPVGRPGSTAGGPVTLQQSGTIERPRSEAASNPSGLGLSRSLRPQARTSVVRQSASKAKKVSLKGAICDNPDVLGEEVGRVRAQVRGCGIENAVRVRSVAGVALSPAALMDCRTALTLNHWVERSAKPRLRKRGGGLSSLRVIGHYSCRTRNNQPGARISEHGKGRAIDISEFRLKNGSSISVLRDWNTKRGFEPLREMHRDACGIFGTVLGPKSDRFHQDHFHFDTARNFSGAYCR